LRILPANSGWPIVPAAIALAAAPFGVHARTVDLGDATRWASQFDRYMCDIPQRLQAMIGLNSRLQSLALLASRNRRGLSSPLSPV
jgi:hypothetical protein